MTFSRLLLPAALFLALPACDPSLTTGSSGVRVSGNAAIGIGSDGSYLNRFGGSGPPPGRNPSEREARQKYYQGPRGNEL